jgi:hypothetical protein
MVVSPRLVPEKPAQRDSDLQMLIPVRTRLDRARVSEYLAAYLDKLRKGVAGALFFNRLAMSKRHTAIMPQRILSPVVNIAHHSKEMPRPRMIIHNKRPGVFYVWPIDRRIASSNGNQHRQIACSLRGLFRNET